MQKIALCLFIGVVLIAPWCLAEEQIITIELVKESYSPGETIQAKITTAPLERALKADQLALYSAGVKKSLAPFFSRYNESTYLLYFDLPTTINNPVALKVERVLYRGAGNLEEITMEKEITLISVPTSTLSIIPAFIVLDENQREFQIQVENRRGSSELNITSSPSIAHVYSAFQTVNVNAKKIFKFGVDQSAIDYDATIIIDHNGVFYKIEILKRQEISERPAQNKTETQNLKTLVFIAKKSEVRKTITEDVSLSGVVSIKNEGNTTLEGILFELTGNLPQITTIDTTFIPMLQPQESKDIAIAINTQQEGALGVYEGALVATAGNQQASFPIAITLEAKLANQPLNYTDIDLDLKKEPIQKDNDINISFPTIPPQEETEYPIGLILITFILIVAAIGFILLKKKKPTQDETFDNYIKKIRK